MDGPPTSPGDAARAGRRWHGASQPPRRRPSPRPPAPARRRSPSGALVARTARLDQPEQQRNFFLDLDHGFGRHQPLAQPLVLLPQPRQLPLLGRARWPTTPPDATSTAPHVRPTRSVRHQRQILAVDGAVLRRHGLSSFSTLVTNN